MAEWAGMTIHLFIHSLSEHLLGASYLLVKGRPDANSAVADLKLVPITMGEGQGLAVAREVSIEEGKRGLSQNHCHAFAAKDEV